MNDSGNLIHYDDLDTFIVHFVFFKNHKAHRQKIKNHAQAQRI